MKIAFKNILPRTAAASGAAGLVAWILYGLICLGSIAAAIRSTAILLPTIVGMIALGLVLMLLENLFILGNSDDPSDGTPTPSWLIQLLQVLIIFGVFALTIIFFSAPANTRLTALAVALAGGLAAIAVGALIGFIFGIPRALQTPTPSDGGSDGSNYAPNTNLERISEWLTSIIVGLTLVNLRKIVPYFNSAAETFAAASGEADKPFIGGALLLFFATAGFLVSYLWTRLRLLQDFSHADDPARRNPEYLEGLMNAYLYVPPPRGFRQVIRKGLEYKKRFGDGNGRVLAYLACAYGQQYSFVSGDPANAAPNESTKDAQQNAYIAARTAIERDETMYQLLYAVWDPGVYGYSDNDLKCFYNTLEFRRLFAEFDPDREVPPLIAATKSGKVERVRGVGKIAPDALDATGRTAMHWACGLLYADIVLHLRSIDARTDIDSSQHKKPIDEVEFWDDKMLGDSKPEKTATLKALGAPS